MSSSPPSRSAIWNSAAWCGTSSPRDITTHRSAAPPNLVDERPCRGCEADQYFGSGTRCHECNRARSNAAEFYRAPARGDTSSPPRAALPAQSLCGSGR
ncbi:hypothetical protein HN011_010848 [Eciton burchellii]|nr:hypothetical protein HN011_010848 [Eciton burchellii]